MKKHFRKLAPLTAAIVLAITFLAAPLPVGAQSAEDIRRGVAASGGSGDSSRVGDVIEVAINIFSIVVGIAAVIMIIIGGMKYVTSSGDSTSVNGAKNTILYAIVGLIVVGLAQVLVKFVLNQV